MKNKTFRNAKTGLQEKIVGRNSIEKSCYNFAQEHDLIMIE